METPFYLRPYPIPYIYREAAKSQIAEMLNWGVIEIANTEYINFLVVVKKKDGGIQVCLAARFLNSRMIKDHVIPPNPAELIFEFAGISYLSTIDLTAWYWQIPIEIQSRK